MAEILVKAINSDAHADPVKDQRGCYKRGHAVVVMPDGWAWGAEERLPKFVLIKIPGISVAAVQSFGYQEPELDVNGDRITRRLWQIRWASLPPAAQTKLQTTGELIIKAGGYNGPFDYTWTQVKQYFRNHATGLDETRDLDGLGPMGPVIL